MRDVGDMVRAAAAGDQQAWEQLVERYTRLIWAITRAHRLRPAEAADVNQVAWLRLVEHLGRLREPERVGSWLAAVTRHECLRVIRRSGREVLTTSDVAPAAVPDEVDATVLAEERSTALWRAFDSLPPHCQSLLRVLMADPRPSYEEVAAALEMPIGSIGPTRQRCLDRLRRRAELRFVADDA